MGGVGVITVAALYVDPRGPYPSMPGVECWDEARDARNYVGPHPVVAHPPCGPWGRLRHLCTKQDPSCAKCALLQVRVYGGVLEHPAGSKLWQWGALLLPGDATDSFFGRTYELNQCDWGHVARKSTWLYAVGCDQQWIDRRLRERRGSGAPTHHVSRDANRARRNGYTLKRTTDAQNKLTPNALAEFLVECARRSVQPATLQQRRTATPQ